MRFFLPTSLAFLLVHHGNCFLSPRLASTSSSRWTFHFKATAAESSIKKSNEILGQVKRIQLGEEDAFLSAMSVPTFACVAADDGRCNLLVGSDPTTTKAAAARVAGHLEGVLRHGPAFCLDEVLTSLQCDDLIAQFEELGFGSYKAGKNNHGAMQIVVSQDIADSVGNILSCHVDIDEVNQRRIETELDGQQEEQDDVRLVYAGLNRRWRVYRYAPGGEEVFAPHIDAGFPPSGLSQDESQLVWDITEETNDDIVARLTLLLYLNDDFIGGETKFYQPMCDRKDDLQQQQEPQVICAIKPRAGSALVFPQGVGEDAVDYARLNWPMHEGSPVIAGNRPKYVIRSDILFLKQVEKIDTSDPYSKHDLKVRDAFLTRSSVFDSKFLHHVESLYNPHMGVENLGPLLYSFIRFTKLRKVVEIGAGYTSLWILQALKDNADEMERIRDLGRSGRCLLLDIPWAVPPVVEDFDKEPPSLLFVDNCKHQKETATGATAVAKTLGLDGLMQFKLGDAFELQLEPESIDLLWCDFGVGTRISEFCAQAWGSVRPGGFLLCHSTLTNRNTRQWLEAVRSRADESITGLPPGDYVELSLLEPHKRYQNSITLLQKRRNKESTGDDFEEPVHSQYA